MLIDRIKSLFRPAARTPRPRVVDDCYSVIVCSVDNRRFAGLSATLAQAFGNQPYEIIRIPDARSMCQGYNEGIRRSCGSRLIFCHDDIEILSEDFVSRLDASFDLFDVFGLIGTTRLITGHWSASGRPDVHGAIVQPDPDNADGCILQLMSSVRKPVRNAQALDGVFIACWRNAAEQLRWDETNISGFHVYDIDFSFRAHLAGLRVGIATDLLIYHASLGKADDNWKQAVLAFEKRYADHLSKLPPGEQTYLARLSRDRKAAYQAFRALLATLSIEKDITSA